MPETAAFGIRFPCSGEPIDCDVFLDFTADIQAALNELDVLQEASLNRPAAAVSQPVPGQTFAPGLFTDIRFVTENFDNDGMVNLVANDDRITIQSPGMYLVSGSFEAGSTFTTVTNESISIDLNGGSLYRKKESSDTNNTILIPPVIGIVNCVAGDILTLAYLWNGTGGPNTGSFATFSAYRVSTP